MDKPSEAIQHGKLVNRLVLDRNTTEEIGRLERLWLDPKNHRVLGLICKSGGLLAGKKQIFNWDRVAAIGDSILIDFNPEESDAAIADKLETVIGHELWTDAGNKAGKLADYLLDSQTGKVIHYIFASNGWMGVVDGTYLLSPEVISSVGSKRVIAEDAAVKQSEQYGEGVGKKISQVGEFFQEDAKQTHKDLKVVQTGLKAALGQAKTVADRLKDKAGTVTERAKEAAGQLKEKASDVTEQAKETAQRAKEKAGEIAERTKSQLQKPPQEQRTPKIIEVDVEAVTDAPTGLLEPSPNPELELKSEKSES